MTSNTVKIYISGDASGVSRASRDAERSLGRIRSAAARSGSGITRALGPASALLAGGLVTGAAAASAKMIDLASDAGEVQSKFDIVFGKTAAQSIKQLDAFAKATGASRFELRQQAADLQALIRPMGFSAGEASKMSLRFSKLATDLSSFANVPAAEALEALRAGIVGEAEPLRKFGVRLSAARVEAEALAMGLVKPTKDAGKIASARLKVEDATKKAADAEKKYGAASLEARKATDAVKRAEAGLAKVIEGKVPDLTDAQKAQAAYNLILKDTKLAQGDATRTAGSFANQQRRLKNAVTDLGTELGQKLLPVATEVVTTLNDNMPEIEKKAKAAFDALGDGVGKVVELAPKVRDVGVEVKGVVEQLGGFTAVAGAGGAFLAVQKLGPAAQSAAQGFAAMRREAALTSRIKTGQLDIFNIATKRIDTSATQQNIRAAYRDIGVAISRAESEVLAKSKRIAAPVGALGRLGGVAKTAGGALVSLAGGPMGVAALAAGGLALGILKVRDGMTDMAKEANDATSALQGLADAQLAAEGAALSVERAELQYDEAQKRRRQTQRDLRRESQQYTAAILNHGRGSREANAAQRQYNQALTSNKEATLSAREAQLRLKEAQDRQVDAQAAVSQGARDLAKEFGGLTTKANQNTRAQQFSGKYSAMAAAGMEKGKTAAMAWADGLVDSAKASETLSEQGKKVAFQVAETVRQLGRVPTETEADLISNALAQGKSIDDVRRLLGLMPPSTPANISSNASAVDRDVDDLRQSLYNLNGNVTTVYIDTVRRNKGPAGGGADGAATGAAIAGRFDARDDVPVNVSRGEVILNPRQIAMVGASRVYGALAATGAPTIRAGGGFAGGGSDKKVTPTERWQKRLDRSSAAYSFAFNKIDAQLSAAELTRPIGDDNVARSRMRTLIRRRIATLRGMLRQNPPRSIKSDIYAEIASLRRSASSYTTLTADAPGDPTGDGGAAIADLEARLAQANARASAAGRNLQLSEAALGAFGPGAGGVHYHSHSIFPPSPDQFRAGAAFMSNAFGRQAYRRSPRIRIGA